MPTAALSRADSSDEEEVALLVAEGVVDLLEVVEVQDHDRGAARASGLDVVQGGAEAALQVRPVRQPGERVVQGLVPQLADQLAVAQRDAGVVGDGLQQDDVVLHEGPDVTLPVGDDEHADDAGRAREGDGHRLPHAVGGEPAAGVGVPGGPRHEQRLPALDDLLEHPVVLGSGRLLRAGEPAAGTQPDAGDEPAVGADERRGRAVGPQQLPRLAEDGGHDLVDLGDAHRLAEAVQPLQVEVPLGEGGVGAVGEQQEGAEPDEQPGALAWRRRGW